MTIISEKWLTETTSTGAAGLFRPYKVEAENEEIAKKWIEDSAAHFWNLCDSEMAADAGVFEIGGETKQAKLRTQYAFLLFFVCQFKCRFFKLDGANK